MDSGIRVEEGSGGFVLRFRGREIFRHGRGHPAVGAGVRDFSYTMSRGMYRVAADRRLAWRDAGEYKITSGAGGDLRIDFPGVAWLSVREESGLLRIEPRAADTRSNALDLRVAARPSEPIYGCGEQFSWLDLRGKRLPLLVSEPGVGRGPNYLKLAADLHSGIGGWRHHTYFPLPAFVAAGGAFVAAEAEAYAVFDFRDPRSTLLSFREIPASISVGVADGLAGAVCGLSALMGRQPAPPSWCQEGAWLGIQGGAETVLAKLDAALRAGARVSALWCQDWQGIRMTERGKQLFWNWEWDRGLYPDPPAFLERLRERGVRFLGYVNPFLAADAPQFAEAASRGFLVKTREGAPYITYTTTFPVSSVDFSNPEARDWFKGLIKRNLLGQGLDGWMADFGEHLPPDCALASGADASRAHNAYAADWAAVNREAVEEAGALGRAIFFCRSGWIGSQRSALAFWGGDQLVNFWRDHGLPSALNAGLSAGMCGAALWHFDVGGFISAAWIRRDRELLARSAELAAFTPFMRSHEGINPAANAQFDSDGETLGRFARMTRVYAALAPYHRSLVGEYVAEGLPPLRLPALHYPDAGTAGAADAQYLYGRDLMIAPILRRGAKSRIVRLPGVSRPGDSRDGDSWIHLWSGSPRGAGEFRESAPFGEPPVYYRASSPFARLFGLLPALADATADRGKGGQNG